MNFFVFQSIPERYDLREALQPGAKDTWYATRYRTQMQPGDLVFFWMAGDEYFRGLYGWGHITSHPYLEPNWNSHGVDVKYIAKFKKPILAKSIKNDSVLAEMLIFRAPQASNFLLTPEQGKRLLKLLVEHGETEPATIGGEP